MHGYSQFRPLWHYILCWGTSPRTFVAAHSSKRRTRRRRRAQSAALLSLAGSGSCTRRLAPVPWPRPLKTLYFVKNKSPESLKKTNLWFSCQKQNFLDCQKGASWTAARAAQRRKKPIMMSLKVIHSCNQIFFQYNITNKCIAAVGERENL